MASVNKVILVGTLGRDPELTKTNGGASVCSFSIATNEKWTDKQGQKHEETEWHNLVLWNKNAENAAQYLKKGSSIYVEGKLKTRSWDDNGTKKYKTEINVLSMQFLDKQGQQSQQQSGGFGGGQPQQQQQSGGFGQQQPQQGGFGQQQPQQPQGGGFGQQQAPQQQFPQQQVNQNGKHFDENGLELPF